MNIISRFLLFIAALVVLGAGVYKLTTPNRLYN
jgi:hypothetical protein